MSSAKRRTWDLRPSGRSFIYTKKIIDLMTEPWGTPLVPGSHYDIFPLDTILCWRWNRKFSIHLQFVMGNLVKCFSRVQQYDICLLVFMQTSTVSVERFDLKLCCISYSIPISKGFRAPPPPPWIWAPRGEMPSDLALPGARAQGISPPFRDLAPPPPYIFELLISYILLGSKTTAKRSAISIHAPIIRDVVNATHL